MEQPIRILQLTDLHLFKSKENVMLNFNPYDSLQQIMLLVNGLIKKQKQKPSLTALTGDVSQDYSQESYEIAKQIFKDMPCRLIATMGNHDKNPTFTDFFNNPDDEVNKIIYLGNWSILFLNSHWPEHVGGKFTENELTFLKNKLEDIRDKNVLIFTHHHILPAKSTWIDTIKVSNAEDFLKIIDQYQNIKAVICGHIHQDNYNKRNNVEYLSTPSTSWQFLAKSPGFKLDSLMPGFRWIDLYEDGTFKTEVIRIPYNPVFIPDLNSAGY